MTVEQKLKLIIKDPVIWIQTFAKVVDKSGKTVPFKMFKQQKYLMDNLGKYNVILKARQQGFSTVAAAYSLYIACTKPNSSCLLMSYSIDSATAIFDKLKQLYNDLPNFAKSPLIANNKKELKFINGSRIVVCTCGNKDNARGMSLAFCHISEIAFFKDNAPKQLLAIEQSMLPDGKIIIESTPNGMNFFQELWAKAERHDNMYKPFFFNWIDGREQFAEEYKQFCDCYIDRHGALPTLDELDDTEMSLYIKGATIEQLTWRRLKIANSSEDEFNQEFPSDPAVAFMTTGSNIFNSQLIYNRLNCIDEVEKLSIPNDLPVSIKQWNNRGFDLFAIPESNKKYYVGVDTAEGVEGDYSVIEVLDEDAKQVAEFKSNKIKPFQFAEIVHDIGIYYNKALLVIEKQSAGHTVVDKLKNDYHYSNMYKYKEYDARGKTVCKVGYVTNAKTKPIMINDFVELFETNQLLINSKDLLKEMKVFAFNDGKMNAPKGSHDDHVMAFAMAIVGLKSKLNYC